MYNNGHISATVWGNTYISAGRISDFDVCLCVDLKRNFYTLGVGFVNEQVNVCIKQDLDH